MLRELPVLVAVIAVAVPQVAVDVERAFPPAFCTNCATQPKSRASPQPMAMVVSEMEHQAVQIDGLDGGRADRRERLVVAEPSRAKLTATFRRAQIAIPLFAGRLVTIAAVCTASR